jgi:hypothetical protein
LLLGQSFRVWRGKSGAARPPPSLFESKEGTDDVEAGDGSCMAPGRRRRHGLPGTVNPWHPAWDPAGSAGFAVVLEGCVFAVEGFLDCGVDQRAEQEHQGAAQLNAQDALCARIGWGEFVGCRHRDGVDAGFPGETGVACALGDTPVAFGEPRLLDSGDCADIERAVVEPGHPG